MKKEYLWSSVELAEGGIDHAGIDEIRVQKSYLYFKHFCDVVVSFCFFLLLLPIYIVIAVLVKADSDGPILYQGVRSGLDGKPFKILKFRTMVPDAESCGGLSTAKDDPRITRVGRYLRRLKLDELPQLINVMRGDMSIVGPRPEMPKYTAEYVGNERLILSIRPGITDFSSIEFSQLGDFLGSQNADMVYEEQVKPIKNNLRVRYVCSMSFSTDISLILRTLLKVATH
jgi:lipopolysaccharide/colanic/teichoic acid biosynthesis glycosyltransferase